MMWVIEDDGAASFRIRAPLSVFGPRQQGAGAELVRLVLGDLRTSGLDIETTGTFTRTRRHPPPGYVETVWTGRVVRSEQLSDAREYFRLLALDYRGAG